MNIDEEVGRMVNCIMGSSDPLGTWMIFSDMLEQVKEVLKNRKEFLLDRCIIDCRDEGSLRVRGVDLDKS